MTKPPTWVGISETDAFTWVGISETDAVLLSKFNISRSKIVGSSERQRELRRRRHRRVKMKHLQRRIEKANVSEKAQLAGKIRSLTPGAEKIIARLNLQER